MASQLSAALRATAAGIHPDEARTGLIISHGAFLQRSDFTRHVETAACTSNGTPMAWIDWHAVIAALDSGHLPSSGTSNSASSASRPASPPGHPVSLRDAIPGLDQRSLHLVATAIRHAAGQRQ